MRLRHIAGCLENIFISSEKHCQSLETLSRFLATIATRLEIYILADRNKFTPFNFSLQQFSNNSQPSSN